MKKILVFLLLVLNSYLIPCTCVYSPIKESYIKADLVFIGKVIKGPIYEDSTYNSGYNFDLLSIYKGEYKKILTIYTGVGWGDCGYEFKEGEIYLVYAYKNYNEYTTSICSRTNHIKDSFVDLEFLNRLPESLNSTSVTGKVTLLVDNSINQYDLPVLQNFTSTIKNLSNSYSVKTDTNGTYYIKDIKPGAYEIFISKELNLAIKKDYYSQLDIKEADVCEFNIVITNINTINGNVKDLNNQPISRGYVQLIPEQYFKDYKNKFLYETYECWLSKNGEYSFRNVPKGNYYLGINMDAESWSVNPYSKTFYQNADDLSSATLLIINEENNYHDIDLRVKKAYKKYKIKCKLITAAGEVYNDYAFIELDRKTEDNKWEPIATSVKLNDEGEYIINTIENTEGWIKVELIQPSKYYEKGLYVKNPQPIKIEPNKNYDNIEIIIETRKR